MTASATSLHALRHANCGSWSIVSSPNNGPNSNTFYGVSADAANDVWAVGDYINGGGTQTLVEQWNGSAWSIVPSQNPGATADALFGVAALAPNNIWAVGDYTDSNYKTQPLIEQWNGTTWNVMSGPTPLSYPSLLNAVAATSPTDIWAVGTYYGNKAQKTLIEHWDGSTWSMVPSPNAGSSTNALNGVAAVSTNDVWAVGYRYNKVGNSFTLTEHWNGKSWKMAAGPHADSFSSDLLGVTAIATDNVWAVGSFSSGFPNRQTLTEQWDGSSWNYVSSPNPSGAVKSVLNGVAAVSSNDVWAVGNAETNGVVQTLVEQWDGSSWNIVPSPNGGSTVNALAGDTVVPGQSQLWTTGNFINTSYKENTLAEYYC